MDRPSQVGSTLLTALPVLSFVLISSPLLPNEPDEAFRLMNVSGSAVDVSGWTVTNGEGTIYDDPAAILSQAGALAGEPDPEVVVFPQGGVCFPVFDRQ